MNDKSGIAIRSRRPYLQGKSASLMKSLANQCFREKIVPEISEMALAKIRYHKNAGHGVILLSGTLDILAEPLRAYTNADLYIACNNVVKDGHFTGDITPPIPYGDGKRDIVLRYTQEHGIKLKECFAYGDSIADVSMFSSVGNPSVVNPGSKLQTIAGEHGWGIEKW